MYLLCTHYEVLMLDFNRSVFKKHQKRGKKREKKTKKTNREGTENEEMNTYI